MKKLAKLNDLKALSKKEQKIIIGGIMREDAWCDREDCWGPQGCGWIENGTCI